MSSRSPRPHAPHPTQFDQDDRRGRFTRSVEMGRCRRRCAPVPSARSSTGTGWPLASTSCWTLKVGSKSVSRWLSGIEADAMLGDEVPASFDEHSGVLLLTDVVEGGGDGMADIVVPRAPVIRQATGQGEGTGIVEADLDRPHRPSRPSSGTPSRDRRRSPQTGPGRPSRGRDGSIRRYPGSRPVTVVPPRSRCHDPHRHRGDRPPRRPRVQTLEAVSASVTTTAAPMSTSMTEQRCLV